MLGLQQQQVSKVWRPWGWYRVIATDEGWWAKELTLAAFQRTSLQYHNEREELWHCPSGKVLAEIGGKIVAMDYDRTYRVPKGINHRLINPTRYALTVTEIAMGNPREDDIERLEDDYGRAD